jgi:hypothetical protein
MGPKLRVCVRGSHPAAGQQAPGQNGPGQRGRGVAGEQEQEAVLGHQAADRRPGSGASANSQLVDAERSHPLRAGHSSQEPADRRPVQLGHQASQTGRDDRQDRAGYHGQRHRRGG